MRSATRSALVLAVALATNARGAVAGVIGAPERVVGIAAHCAPVYMSAAATVNKAVSLIDEAGVVKLHDLAGRVIFSVEIPSV
mgnify:CR=1 FL=1